MANILISGGSGFIGSALAKKLAGEGNNIVVLTRSRNNQSPLKNISYSYWDPSAEIIDRKVLFNADAVVHLAGAGVADKRWTPERKKELFESRVKSAQLLMNVLKETPNNVKTIVSASAIGFYGADPVIPNPSPFVEGSKPAEDFLGRLSEAWEGSVALSASLGIRLVILRTGIVLGNGGGAYPEFKKTLPFGMATILGSGKQVISWIHLEDLVQMYSDVLQKKQYSGIYNGVSPNPVSNRRLILAIASQRQKFFVPVHIPSFVLKAMMGEMSV
ncbi:MAG: TIGR01777 family oxidoreductase, partial [Flavisolibacter sp.]